MVFYIISDIIAASWKDRRSFRFQQLFRLDAAGVLFVQLSPSLSVLANTAFYSPEHFLYPRPKNPGIVLLSAAASSVAIVGVEASVIFKATPIE